MKHWETLVDLASLVIRVDNGVKLLSADDLTAGQYRAIRDDLNRLQRIAPEYAPVIGARVKWFERGLESFERHLVQPVVEHREGCERMQIQCPDCLLMHWEMLRHFLTPQYLGEEKFTELCHRVDRSLDLLIGATDGMFHALWNSRKEGLLLIAGRRNGQKAGV